MVVSQEVRRAHSRAIHKRNKWKAQYRKLGSAIRAAKQMIAAAHRRNSVDVDSELHLRAMRAMAEQMMQNRNDIKNELRETAYTYASQEELEQAA